MRDILFRGKRVDNGEWVEGYLFDDGIVDSKRMFIGSLVITEHKGQGEDVWDIGHAFYEVIPETVGQYTGLTDKNEKKIFEGDIVDCWSEGVNAQGTVQQRKDGLWIIYPAWQKHIMWGLCPDEYSHTTVEVIGNIHDNPELLEVK